MYNTITLATCSLNQWALDFQGNYERILQSLRIAKERGAVYRLGPELEISGYGCNDHFFEADTYLHSLEVLAKLLVAEEAQDILVDVGMPVVHRSARYNCRVYFYNKRILLIRPKLFVAMNGNYREGRWFMEWKKLRQTEEFNLPGILRKVTGQSSVPFGDGVIAASDVTIGSEICEELFTPRSPHIAMGLDGVDIFTNGSGSHHELRKLNVRLDLIKAATSRVGGVYMYANHQGNDGERVYYDGCALIALNGQILAQGTQFSVDEVEVVTATVDLGDIRTYRGSLISLGQQATSQQAYPRFELDRTLCHTPEARRHPTRPIEVHIHTPAEEIALGPACWLWDYLRRSGLGGFFLPLSGGIDSSSTATIVHSMCVLVTESIAAGNEQTLSDLRRIVNNPEFIPSTSADVANLIFHTMFMGTTNNSAQTRASAKELATQIGAFHWDVNIDAVVTAIIKLFTTITGKTPQYKVHGGTNAENLALQNIQARFRMILAYMFGSLAPWIRGLPSRGLLVLGSANVDECLRGYYTKYDCSSADINPIGGVSKVDLKMFVRYAAEHYKLTALAGILEAPPTAELEPITAEYTQTDEQDMGMSYEELSVYGRLRKHQKCGPYSMFCKLTDLWHDKLDVSEIAEKVKFFFRMYSINRHKTTTLTPSYHAESYSPDDNRFDLRPFLYNSAWTWQFRKIDHTVRRMQVLGTDAAVDLPSEPVTEDEAELDLD
eukprot:m.5975 g.5975  ORF g.5975 m.5975 type:complete len:721 (-) comp5113_c0_seq2:232-2394(-)